MNDSKQENITRIIGLFAVGILLTLAFMSTRNPRAIHGQSLTVTGPMQGVVFMFNSSGAPMSQYYCAVLTGNSTTSGTFSLTGTGPLNPSTGIALWTTPASAWIDNVSVVSPGTAVTQSYTPYGVTLSISSNAITVTGTVKSPTTLVALGATAINSSVAEPMVVKVCSN